MPLLETVLSIYGAATGSVAVVSDLGDFIKSRTSLEDALTDLTKESFQTLLPRLEHLCVDGPPVFNANAFRKALTNGELDAQTPDDLAPVIAALLPGVISLPGAQCAESDFIPIFDSIASSAVRGLFKKISRIDALANQVLLQQNTDLADGQDRLCAMIAEGFVRQEDRHETTDANLTEIVRALQKFAEFWRDINKQVANQLLDAAPPPEHTIDNQTHRNPFLLKRSEDFNHNYVKLAKLFQKSPEWDSIQSRTENVFIEGGRGTGKSMLLRRLTAQATVAAKRMTSSHATFSDTGVDYFGVYVKLARGYYDRFGSVDAVGPHVAPLLAQHELNIEIFDAFADALLWLQKEHALPELDRVMESVIADLCALFPKAKPANTLTGLQQQVVRFEQDQINTYYREKAFQDGAKYTGSATDTVTFLRGLSRIFRKHLFPDHNEMRLFLLVDEFETLTEVQQMALNTVIKMRLTDLSMKVAARRSGRKTDETFTQGDPIQQPRDYTQIPLDYDVRDGDYRALLAGIAAKRLEDAGYSETDIRRYLPPRSNEVTQDELDRELTAMWDDGNRRKTHMDDEFRAKYSVAATYRLLTRSHKRKSYCGFDEYALLSSGIVSNFIEVCKYAFYFALSDALPLKDKPDIPSYLQTDAANTVSQRLFAIIDSNVPVVGSVLKIMLSDIGSVLRSRLMCHPSEPEANRLSIPDYGRLDEKQYDKLSMVIDAGIIWSVFHLRAEGEAFYPKNSARPPSAELIINRIYCPALQISPRARWRVKMSLNDLSELIDPNARPVAYQRLMRSVGASPDREPMQPALFEETECYDE